MAKATPVNADFTNVKEGGVFNTKRIEAGDYLAKIVKVEDSPVKSGENKGRAQYLFTLQLVDLPSSKFPYYCQIAENQLWKLRNILVAAGKTVPKRKQKVDPNQIVGKLIGVSIEDDEYENKVGKTVDRSVVNGVFPASDLPNASLGKDDPRDDSSDDDDEDYQDAPLEDEEVEETEEEEDEVEEEADPLADLSRAQLKAAITKINADFRAKKSQSDDDLRDILRKLNDSDEDDDEEDEEPTPPPAKKKAAATKKASAKKTTTKKSKPKPEDIDDEELDELDIDNL